MSRGFALLSQPIDSLYDTVLKSCNDLDVSSLNANKNNYKIGGKKGAGPGPTAKTITKTHMKNQISPFRPIPYLSLY